MGHTIQLLESALQAWEDCRLIEEAVARLRIVQGRGKPEELTTIILHWRELRKHLLMASTAGFDYKRFCMVPKLSDVSLPSTRDLYQEYPLQLASWITSSRRVFCLSEDLITRFISADYSHYQWSDLLWPFDSFAIKLDQPHTVQNEDGVSGRLSLVLVSSIGRICPDYPFAEQDGFEVSPFYSAVEGKELPTELLPRKEKERLDNDVRAKRWNKIEKRFLRFSERILELLDARALPAGNYKPYALQKAQIIRSNSSVAKIIAGLCLYLEALPSRVSENYAWCQPAPTSLRREVRKIITDGEQICQVEDFHVLSPDTITLFPETLKKGPAYTVTPHWRRAHYRRPKGQGSNPNAPKTVRVEATLIHKDQLPKGALPGGSISSVR